MDQNNFWYWMIVQAKDFLLTYFLPFLPQHVDWGLAQIMITHGAPALGLLFVTVGELVHLGTIFKVIQLWLLVEGVRLLLAGRKIIARLIKIGATFGMAG